MHRKDDVATILFDSESYHYIPVWVHENIAVQMAILKCNTLFVGEMMLNILWMTTVLQSVILGGRTERQFDRSISDYSC